MKKLALHWQVIIAMILGVVYAYFAVTNDWVDFTQDYVMPFGDIFLRLLKMIAPPLVLFSIIVGVSSLKDIRKLGKMGLKTLGMYLATTFFAVGLGLLVVNVFAPGKGVDDDLRVQKRIEYELWRDANGIEKFDTADYANDPQYAEQRAQAEEALNASADNQNAWVKDKMSKHANEKKKGPLQPLVDIFPSNALYALNGDGGSTQMIQIIFFAIFFGVVLVSLPEEKGAPVIKVIDGLSEIFIQMVWVLMKGMPFFVFALMAGQVVKAAGADPDNLFALLDFLLRYSGVVVLGLLAMAFVVYPSLVQVLAKRVGFGKFFKGMGKAQLTAFSTSSSVATLPVTMDCVNNNIGVSERTTSFVLPIGATVNMDGTSLYQGVAVVAMAQLHMIDLSFGQQMVIVGTATVASIGAAAVPSAGLVLMMVVLESVGLNPAWIALIFPVDRILDMCRTVVNVTGDGAVSTIIAASEGELDEDIGEGVHPQYEVG